MGKAPVSGCDGLQPARGRTVTLPGQSTPGDTALTALALEAPARLLVDEILEAAREYLDMDVAFVAEFAGGEQVFRHVAGDAALFCLSSELRTPLGWMYCQAMTEGGLPEATPPAAAMETRRGAHTGSSAAAAVTPPGAGVGGAGAARTPRAAHGVGK